MSHNGMTVEMLRAYAETLVERIWDNDLVKIGIKPLTEEDQKLRRLPTVSFTIDGAAVADRIYDRLLKDFDETFVSEKTVEFIGISLTTVPDWVRNAAPKDADFYKIEDDVAYFYKSSDLDGHIQEFCGYKGDSINYPKWQTILTADGLYDTLKPL